MDNDWEEAMGLLEAGAVESDRRHELAGIVRDYVEQLERMANVRGEKLKEIARGALSPPGRRREVTGYFCDGGREFVMGVLAYDEAWLADFCEAIGSDPLLLRPETGKQVPEDWRDYAMPFTVEDVKDGAQPGDLQLVLKLRSYGELPEGGAVAHFFVRSAGLVRPNAPTDEHRDPITASRICEAIAKGVVRADVRRTPAGITVHFEDVVREEAPA